MAASSPLLYQAPSFVIQLLIIKALFHQSGLDVINVLSIRLSRLFNPINPASIAMKHASSVLTTDELVLIIQLPIQ